jgi:hypothetical protein
MGVGIRTGPERWWSGGRGGALGEGRPESHADGWRVEVACQQMAGRTGNESDREKRERGCLMDFSEPSRS